MLKLTTSHTTETIYGNLTHREIHKTELITDVDLESMKQEKAEPTYTFDCRQGFMDMPAATYLELRELCRKRNFTSEESDG